ncbi:hypothetical protein V6M85_07730 [Sulfolobus tengchongensis]|uniref:AAA+ ATPase domain-containing protein n=1 Tax=Sulfolobus tengchongensis TaxID=207809 RepID=A0AAX4KX09_9CREN
MCEFEEYTVSKYGDENVRVAGKVWTETIKIIENAIMSRKNAVITILGQPGMGKTLILNAVKKELNEKAFILYLDLVSSPSLSKASWYTIRNTTVFEKIRNNAFKILYEHKKEIGYGLLEKMSKEFTNWMRHLCEKRKWSGNYVYAERLYCMAYEENVEGFIEFLNDLINLGPVGLLIDELKNNEGQLLELHKIINETKIPIVITLVPDVISQIKDSALRRRLDEFKIELKLRDEDKLDILKTYCEEFAEDLINIKEIKSSDTVNKLLDSAREAYNKALSSCKDEYKKMECIKNELKREFEIENIEDASKMLEAEIRQGLLELQKEYNIDYIHDRGKRIEQVGITIDIFFRRGNIEYLGDIKLTNENTVENIRNVKKLIGFNRDGAYEVRKFIVTNSTNVDLNEFKIITVDNRTIKDILNSNREKRNELVRRILKELEVTPT